ncbi:ribonuclease P protein subunit [Candidatus Woesearchaeota archaeon]|nr:ribonuclease P protein subunit [Candidatus Woesearchaeota archaeon]
MKQNKYQKNYIGKTIEITKTKNMEQQGIKGIITNETKNTFQIQTIKKSIKILKNNKEFKIQNETIQGNKIAKKPEERIKIKG